jgi:alpha 1,3-glucosidase
MIGSDLLVHPVTKPGSTEVEVLFPSKDLWYEAESLVLAASEKPNDSAVMSKTVPADMNTIPVFQRGGSVIPRKLRLRRSTLLMKSDPYTLYVALDRSSKAQGSLYMDDEETFSYRTQGKYAMARFNVDLGGKVATMSNSVELGSGWSGLVTDLHSTRMIERVVVAGLRKKPSAVTLEGEILSFDFNSEADLLVIRKPSVSVLQNWTMLFS